MDDAREAPPPDTKPTDTKPINVALQGVGAR